MGKEERGRREFLKSSFTTAAGLAWASAPLERKPGAHGSARRGLEAEMQEGKEKPANAPSVRFAAIGLNHGHINGQVDAAVRGGGELVSFFAKEPELAGPFSKRYPQASLARSAQEILEDDTIRLVLSAAIPNERAPLGIEVMRHGKDFMVDKPGITSLEQLAEVRRVQAQTHRLYSILYSERLENRATVKAGALVKAGAIGGVIQTIGLGPHRMSPKTRPDWFFQRERYGGILCDIGSHQFDQFLFFTGSSRGEVVAAQVGNVHHPEQPGIEDFGDAVVRGDGGVGYVRVDWFTPDGLDSWGDGRLTILGTEGFIEVRKNIDIAGRPGGSHLFLVNQKETRYFDCSREPLPYGEQLVSDVLNRTETAMSQEHCFQATELALHAQRRAERLNLQK
jgi:predicted dehydrogenase